MKQCKVCRAALPEDARFCPFCETELIEKMQLSAPRPKRRRKILAGLLALALLAGGFGLWQSLRYEPQVYNAGAPVTEMQYTAADGVNYRLFLSFAETAEEAEPCERIRLPIPEGEAGQARSLLCALPEGGTLSDGAAFAELIDHVDVRAEKLSGSEALERGEAAYDADIPFAAAALPLRYTAGTGLHELGWILHMKNGDAIYLHQYVNVQTVARVYNFGAPAVDMQYTAEDGVNYRLFLTFAETEEAAAPAERILLPIPESGTGQFVSLLCAVPEGGTLADGAAFAGRIEYVEIRTAGLNASGPQEYDGTPQDVGLPFAAAAVKVDYDEGWGVNELNALTWILHMKNGDVIYMHHFVFVGNGA